MIDERQLQAQGTRFLYVIYLHGLLIAFFVLTYFRLHTLKSGKCGAFFKMSGIFKCQQQILRRNFQNLKKSKRSCKDCMLFFLILSYKM